MNMRDAAMLLAMAAALDGRITADTREDATLKAELWAKTLDADLPLGEAGDILTRHYAETDRVIMPSEINRVWRAIRRERREAERQAQALEEQRQAEMAAVPMPPEIREAIRAIEARTVIPDA